MSAKKRDLDLVNREISRITIDLQQARGAYESRHYGDYRVNLRAVIRHLDRLIKKS